MGVRLSACSKRKKKPPRMSVVQPRGYCLLGREAESVACRVGQRSRTDILRCALLRQMAALLHLKLMRHTHSAIPIFAGAIRALFRIEQVTR